MLTSAHLLKRRSKNRLNENETEYLYIISNNVQQLHSLCIDGCSMSRLLGNSNPVKLSTPNPIKNIVQVSVLIINALRLRNRIAAAGNIVSQIKKRESGPPDIKIV